MLNECPIYNVHCQTDFLQHYLVHTHMKVHIFDQLALLPCLVTVVNCRLYIKKGVNLSWCEIDPG